MGVVLKAFDPSLSRIVAIKVLAPQMAVSGAARRRFFREAKAAAAVVHDHVIAIYAVDTDPGSSLPYLVMPCIAGCSLQDRIDRDGPLRNEEVLRIGMQTALGLAAAHAQGLVHRDIKPSNILLENGVERVKITDFGLARAIDDASQSHSGVVAGTPQYMSPEQAQGETADHRADLFSLGSVLYTMCAGHSPFRAKTMMGVLRRVCDESPRPLGEINPDVPAALEAVIERLHAKDPALRYQSASEIAEVLGRQLAQLQSPGGRTSRRAAVAVPQLVAKTGPTAKKAEPVDDWVPVVKPRFRVLKLATAALLSLLGLAVITSSARFASSEATSPPTSLAAAGFSDSQGAGQGAGQGRPSANVIISNQGDRDRATIVGSEKPATKVWNLADFTSVEIIHPFRAEVTRADRFNVTVTADDNVLDHVVVAKDGTRLRVGLEDNRSYRLRRNSLKVAIAMPVLNSIDLSHGARAATRGFESHGPFEARASHGSLLEGTLKAGRLVLNATHGSEVALTGTADTARLDAAHGSQLPLEALVIRDAEIQLSHGSTATINARPEKGLKAGVHHGSTLAGVIQGGTVDLEAEHGSRATLAGSARTARLRGGFSSRLPLGELTVEGADVHLNHDSSATVRATNKLDYRLEFSSSLKYHGQPAIGTSASSHGSSASAIRPGEEGAKKAAAAAAMAGQGQRLPTGTARTQWDGDELITIELRSWGEGGRFFTINQGTHQAGVIEGSGRQATKSVDVKDFSAIQIEQLFQADVTRADSFQVRLTADDNVLERIEAVREGPTLHIRLASGGYRFRERPRASITLPILEGIDVAGAARATIQGFASDRPFRARASGASTLEGSIRAGDVGFDISGASTLKLSGSARGAQLLASGASKLELADWQVNGERVVIDISGASSARLRGSARAAILKAEGASSLLLADLALEAADVVLGGSSSASVRVKSLLNYEISAASRLEYLGEPTIGKAKRTGGSLVSHRQEIQQIR